MDVQDTILTIDERGFVHLMGLKICRYNQAQGRLEFQDKRRTSKQGRRYIEVTPERLASELRQLVG